MDKNGYTFDDVSITVVFISWENNNENATKTEEILYCRKIGFVLD